MSSYVLVNSRNSQFLAKFSHERLYWAVEMIGSRRCVCPLSQCLYVNLGPLQRPTLPSSLQNDCRTGRLWRGRSCWLSPPQRTGAPTTRGLRCQLFNAIKTHRKTKSQSKGVYNVFSLWHKLKKGRLRKEICFSIQYYIHKRIIFAW